MAMTEPALADTGQFDFFLRVEVTDDTAFFLDDSPPPSSAGRLRVRGAVLTAGQIKSPPLSSPQKTRQTINGVKVEIDVRRKENGNIEMRADAKRGDQTLTVRYSAPSGEDLGIGQAEISLAMQFVKMSLIDPQNANQLCGCAGITLHHDNVFTQPVADEEELDQDELIALTRESWTLYDKRKVFPQELLPGMVCSDKSPLNQVINRIKLAARTRKPVLVLGEKGAGKEAIAQALHNCRKLEGKCVTINCAELKVSDQLIVTGKLFGYGENHGLQMNKQGVKGDLQVAQSGTIFFDEIGDMPLDTQTVLLRVLENKKFRPAVGVGTETEPKVCYVGATNKNLIAKVQIGEFRADFFDRWKTITIKILPLRQRLEDIPALVVHFTKNRNKPLFAEDLFKALFWYRWPGNVRELGDLCTALSDMSPEMPVSLTTLKDFPLDETICDELKQAYIRYEQARKESDLGSNEIQIINKLTEISAAMFPSAFEALAAKNETTTNWEQEIIKGQQSFKDFLLQIHPNKADALQKATNCFEMLTACYPDKEHIPKKILRLAYESSRECVDLSSELEKPRYKTFDQFFGRKYDAVRK